MITFSHQALVYLAIFSLVTTSAVRAATPDNRPPQEITGSVPTSLHVPPIRKSPPARTRPIQQPPQYDSRVATRKQQLPYKLESLRLAIEDLVTSFADAYPDGPSYLERWNRLWQLRDQPTPALWRQFRTLRDEALLANPLLDFDQLIVLKRRQGQLGLPTNHQCNSCLERTRYDNELAVLSPIKQDAQLRTLMRPDAGQFVGEMDLHYDAERLLFTMPTPNSWQIFEINVDGTDLRQVSREVPDVDNFDGCYTPDGRIVYSSTASFTAVPCWHGKERACCLYSMDRHGNDVRQLCFDQDLDLHPSVLSNGQIIYSRWDYTGILHAYVRPLMVMNPDGTGQRAVYGSNCYYPNCLFFPRSIPGESGKIAAILTGYHGTNRAGELALLDITAGWQGKDGVLHRITRRDEPVVPATLDELTKGTFPQFLHPWPLNDKYLLTAMQPGPQQPWGIYLVDVFDNVTPILVDPQFDFFEPLPVKPRQLPPAIPDRTDPSRDDAVIVVHDVYRGPGLRGVPRGTIKQLRIVAYHFGYPGMAGPDKIGRAGPWESMRILGTVPVYQDGSAKFRVPANTPISIQTLDSQGKAVQLMRSWYTAMPGETTSCVGCHETPRETPVSRTDMAASRPISEIQPWYGPARGFDFAREVQPVLNRHCVGCHQGQTAENGQTALDLRDERLVEDYDGLPLTYLGATRLDPVIRKNNSDRFAPCPDMPRPYGTRKTLYTPAYDSLIPFVRRVNIEDSATLLKPGEYHADTSELVQLLQKGHYGVELTEQDWDRLVTWIDLNAPCHGTWSDVAEIPHQADQRRYELAQQTGGPKIDPEWVPESADQEPVSHIPLVRPPSTSEAQRQHAADRLPPLPPADSGTDNSAHGPLTLDLKNGHTIDLVFLRPGRFLMGDTTGDGHRDERPAGIATIEHGFWLSKTEITNAQFRTFFPQHTSGVFTKRQIQYDGPGIQLDAPQQPVVRVNWHAAMEFCRQLSSLTGQPITLPTERQWEYAARAGTVSALCYGDVTDDFSEWGNMADRSLACFYTGSSGVAVLQPIPARMQVDDLAIGTADVASYQPNAWGIYDLHGNAAEWTRSPNRPHPPLGNTTEFDDSHTPGSGHRVVRGGSFYDRPKRCRSSYRIAYPAWQSMQDVGFRIVIETSNRG